jgi:hypothetical protein
MHPPHPVSLQIPGTTRIAEKRVGAISRNVDNFLPENTFYTTQNHWVFGLCPSSRNLAIRKHNVSETGSVSVLR